MRVAIDVRTVTEARSGVGNYVLNLLAGLRRVAPEHEFFLVGQEHNLKLLAQDQPARLCHQARLSHESHPWGDLWEHLWLPRVLRQNSVQVMHGPATLIPLSRDGFASVATIHDLVAFLYPQTIPTKYALYMTWLLKRVVKSARRIISVSQCTKDDLVRVLDVDPERIAVIHEAAQPGFRPIGDQAALEAVRRRHGITKPFFFHVGNIEPRKNLVGLLKAFISLGARLKGQAQLVIGGQEGWLTRRLHQQIGRLDLGPEVIFTGYLPQEDLPLLMTAACAFVFPSLYEGCGLPALEAMSCGTPLITSNLSSLPEIAGEAALLVEPTSPEDIAQAMWRVFEDLGLRQDLCRRGLEQAARFSWDQAARQTMRVYLEAHQERTGR
ncbi:MAG: glycosyltransferase family 4 protein [Desulfarculus sp.]|nr:glycosyltransferase family 4 protein [Desulfarculus sp.]